MSLFFTDTEAKGIPTSTPVGAGFYWHLLGRAAQIAAVPGLAQPETNTDWHHHIFETITTAAAAVRLKNDPAIREWLRSTALMLAGLPVDQWIGPWFRTRTQPPIGHLETAHLSMSLALALDLGEEAFTEPEKTVIAAALREKGIGLCRNWLNTRNNLANWRSVLLAGVSVAAAVLDDRDLLRECLDEYRFCCGAFQDDGSYGESLQYSGYAAWALMMTHEALLRAMPELTGELPMPYAGFVTWSAYSLIAEKPLSDWGDLPRPRSVNFNDSAAIFAPSPDLLLHLASRGRNSHPREAALARHLFDRLYSQQPNQGPFDRSSFGFIPRYGFLTPALLAQTATAATPEELGLALTARFGSGPAIARSSWSDQGTVLAVSGVPDPLHCAGHMHADLNSIIIAHDGEVFLADPGHSCYRNIIHEFETSTRAHNTCTFIVDGSEMQQRTLPQRHFDKNKQLEPPLVRPGRHLLSARIDDVTVFANDIAASYGVPISEFTRICVAAGAQAFFVIDRITATAPVRTKWNWLLNNRDGQLEYKTFSDRMVFRRGRSGMKMFFRSGEPMELERKSGYIHDAYHPLPGCPGEGTNNSGIYFNLIEKTAAEERRTVIHAFAVDNYGASARWHFKTPDDTTSELEYPGGSEAWRIQTVGDDFIISARTAGHSYVLSSNNDIWTLKRQI